jgi:Arc/MetJ family transcription regulator
MLDDDGWCREIRVFSASGASFSRPWRASLKAERDHSVYIASLFVYTCSVVKHLIDLDEDALSAAQAELGTTTIKDTVNKALQRASERRQRRVSTALDVLAKAELADRAEAWR